MGERVKTTHIRIARSTKQALNGLAKMWEEELGNDWAPAPAGWHVSYDAIILELIRRDAAHRQRARAQQERRRGNRPDGPIAPSDDGEGEPC